MGGSSGTGAQGPVRRAVLAALPAGAALAALAACTSGGSAPSPKGPSGSRTTPPPSPDEVARRRAATTALALLAAVTAATGVPRGVRDAVAAGHRAHLVALGVTTGTTATATSTASASTTPATGTPAAPAPSAVVGGEAAGARQALADVPGVGREVATLLVRIAAARAAHADVVARATKVAAPGDLRVPVAAAAAATAAPSSSGPASGTTLPTLAPSPAASLPAEDVEALSRLVEAEHAAVFGYAVVVPRVRTGRQDLARRLWDEHRARRDVVESAIIAAGARPPAALPAYALDVPADSAKAADLAARIEAGVAGVAVWSAGRGSGAARARAADLAVVATRHRAQWLDAVPPFTG